MSCAMNNHNEIFNMKKNIPLLLTSLLFFTAADVQAQEEQTENCCDYSMNFYAKFFSGPNFLQNTKISGNKTSYQTGYIVSGMLGYSWCNYGMRLEAEYAYRRNAISKIHFISGSSSRHGHFQNSSFMGNLFWDLPLCKWGCSFWKIQPFVGAGMGFDYQDMHASNSLIVFNDKWNKFSWQAMAGFAFPLFRNAEITVEYKFHQGGGHFYNHAIGVALVYKFGFIGRESKESEAGGSYRDASYGQGVGSEQD